MSMEMNNKNLFRAAFFAVCLIPFTLSAAARLEAGVVPVNAEAVQLVKEPVPPAPSPVTAAELSGGPVDALAPAVARVPGKPEWIFDQGGYPALILDGDCLRDGQGHVVGWISNKDVYTLYGLHAGWFENGIFYDSWNRQLGFLKNSVSVGSYPSLPGISGVPGMPGFMSRPARPGLSTPPGRPGPAGAWSSEDLVSYFRP